MQTIPVSCRVTKTFRSLLVPKCSRPVNIAGSPLSGKKAVAGCEPRPRPKRRKTHWTKFADTDVNEDGAETQERTSGVLLPLWKPSQGTSLCPLKRAAESMVGGRRYKCIEAVVDSGAEETVAPRGAFPGRARTSAMSRAGACYRTISGAPIPNVGELDVQFLTNAGYPAEIPFQLADIERPLIAVSALAKAGNFCRVQRKRRQDHASLSQSDWPRTLWRHLYSSDVGTH